MSYLRSNLPHNPDFPTVAEELRKLIKRTDELEIQNKAAQQKINQYEKDIVKLNNRCDTFGNKIQELEAKNLMLENRCKAVYVFAPSSFIPPSSIEIRAPHAPPYSNNTQPITHQLTRPTNSDQNALARLLNSRIANPDHVLTPLKEAATNLPIKSFPKHERDIRTMSATEVTTTLRSLDQPTTGPTVEQKSRLRQAVGRDTSTPTSALKPEPPSDSQQDTTTTTTKRPPPAKRAMSIQDKKLAGIKAAKAKLAQNRQYGGAADPRVRKRGSLAGSTAVDVGGEGAAGRKKGVGVGEGEGEG
ncbi:MAG: hypothetical protein Q9195_001682 [Heterodermia aff. obscurata]